MTEFFQTAAGEIVYIIADEFQRTGVRRIVHCLRLHLRVIDMQFIVGEDIGVFRIGTHIDEMIGTGCVPRLGKARGQTQHIQAALLHIVAGDQSEDPLVKVVIPQALSTEIIGIQYRCRRKGDLIELFIGEDIEVLISARYRHIHNDLSGEVQPAGLLLPGQVQEIDAAHQLSILGFQGSSSQHLARGRQTEIQHIPLR